MKTQVFSSWDEEQGKDPITSSVRQEKKNKRNTNWAERNKALFASEIILCRKSWTICPQNILELISELVKSQDSKLLYKNKSCLLFRD